MGAAEEVDPNRTGEILHASCVAYQGRALLITGASGSGKSGLALQLMAFGTDLVADDRTRVWAEKGQVLAAPAPNIERLIEMRGLGLLQADHVGKAAVIAVVDLDLAEADRLPGAYVTRLVGIDLPLLKRVDSPIFPAALLQYLKAGRRTP